MYVWPDGQVTGAVHHGALEQINEALSAGTLAETLNEFPQLRQFIPEHLSADDYPRPKKTTKAKAAAKEEAKSGDDDVPA